MGGAPMPRDGASGSLLLRPPWRWGRVVVDANPLLRQLRVEEQQPRALVNGAAAAEQDAQDRDGTADIGQRDVDVRVQPARPAAVEAAQQTRDAHLAVSVPCVVVS